VRNSADVTRTHGHDDIAIPDHVHERVGKFLYFLDKHGSTSPRPRTARRWPGHRRPESEFRQPRYTSVTNSASAMESALLKSSIRSCVRV